MALPTTFAAQTQSTGPQLDNNFNATGNMGLFPCTVAGTNDLVLTPTAGITPAVAAYANYKQFSGIVLATNSGALTARVGALAILPVFKPSASGPIACTGGELNGSCAFTLVYDSALNAGGGGFHLVSTTSYSGHGGHDLILTQLITGGVTLNPTLAAPYGSLTSLRVGATAATVTRILSASGTLTFTVVPANTNQMQTLACTGAQVNDVVQVGPPASVVAGTSFMGHVLAAGTIGVTAVNGTAASLTPTVGIYRVAVTGFT